MVPPFVESLDLAEIWKEMLPNLCASCTKNFVYNNLIAHLWGAPSNIAFHISARSRLSLQMVEPCKGWILYNEFNQSLNSTFYVYKLLQQKPVHIFVHIQIPQTCCVGLYKVYVEYRWGYATTVVGVKDDVTGVPCMH